MEKKSNENIFKLYESKKLKKNNYNFLIKKYKKYFYLSLLFFVLFFFILLVKSFIISDKKICILDDTSYNKIEDIDTYLLDNIESKLKDYSEMSPLDRRFLNGIIRKYKPKKILEVGVSKGGSSLIILNAIKNIPGARLYSIDKTIMNYRLKDKKMAF